MTRRFSSLLLTAPLAGTLALAACSHGPSRHPEPVSAAPERASLDDVIAALNQGDEAGARKQIRLIQKRSPNDPSARVLEESIEKDPVELLGPKSFTYAVQPGDTMVGLADRFLGNRLKFYQLARYNGIKVPATLAAGTVLHIPGTPPTIPKAKPAPRATEPAPTVKPARPRPTPPPVAAPPTPATNPALARQMRAAGLAALNQGKVDRAVVLLGRAAALDPGNPLIARDLSRAQRIAQTVHAQH